MTKKRRKKELKMRILSKIRNIPDDKRTQSHASGLTHSPACFQRSGIVALEIRPKHRLDLETKRNIRSQINLSISRIPL